MLGVGSAECSDIAVIICASSVPGRHEEGREKGKTSTYPSKTPTVTT